MKIELKFGHHTQQAELGDWQIAGLIQGRLANEGKNEDEVIDEALAHPIDSAPLSHLVHPGERVCVIFPDITRSWQHTDRYLPKIVAQLAAGGVRDEDILFLCATGTHRIQTEEEHAKLLGPELAGRFRVCDNDCRDEAGHKYLGTTSHGTPVEIDRRALECDRIVLTGGIVYHLLAGWSGGKKSLLPGISSYRTIMANHGLSLVPGLGNGSRPAVHSGNLKGNLVHEDMMEAASFVKPDFLFNVVTNSDNRIVGAVAGNYVGAHAEGRRIVAETESAPVPELSDVVIASAGGFPRDINLYQSCKLLINAREAVRPGGIIILTVACGEGLGDDPGIVKMFTGFDSLEEREKFLRDDYTIAKYIGYYFCAAAAEFHIILVSSLKPGTLHGTGITMVPTLAEAVRLAREEAGPDAVVRLMPTGADTFPILTPQG